MLRRDCRMLVGCVVLSACTQHPPHLKQTAPPDIRTRCVLASDGVDCAFGNAGGAGDRCVVVLLAVHSTETVSASGPLCSGPLGLGGEAGKVARFAVRPGDVCGPGLSDCSLRVVEVGTSGTAAEGWAAELRARRSPPPTASSCARLLDHALALQLAEETGHLEGDQRAAREAEIRRSLETWRAQLDEDCRAGMTRTQVDCALAAASLEKLRACAP